MKLNLLTAVMLSSSTLFVLAGADANANASGSHEHHSHEHHSHGQESAVGSPAPAQQADKTIQVSMLDTMKYVFSDDLAIDAGEVVRFVVANKGKLQHEFSIGNGEEQKKHAAMMRENPAMVHEDGNTLSLQPGETGEITWRFAGDPDVMFACNIPGHFDAGMYQRVALQTGDGHSHEHQAVATDGDFVAFSGLDGEAAKIVTAFRSALEAGDKASALGYLSEDLTIFEDGGVERSASQYSSGHMDADITFFSQVEATLIEHHVEQMGDMAVSLSRTRVTGTYDGEAVDSEGMETVVLQRIKGNWKITHIHWSNF